MKRLLVAFFISLSLLSYPLHAQSAQDDRFEIYQGGKYGYMNREGQVVIEPNLGPPAYVLKFSEGLANFAEYVKPLPKLPYVDRDGHVRFTPPEKWGFIDANGKEVVPAKYDGVWPFSEGLAAVYVDDGLGWGFINKQGQMVIQRQGQFYATERFSEGLAAVKNGDGKWGYIDTTGKVVIPYSFEGASAFSDGRAAVTLGEQYAYIDKKGVMVIRGRFTSRNDFSDGVAAVRVGGRSGPGLQLGLPGGRLFFIGTGGATKIKIGRRIDFVHDFREGMAVVEKSGGSCGYIDLSGATVVTVRYKGCDDFSEGLAAVFKDGKWAYIDKAGRTVLSTPYSRVHAFKNGLAEVEEGESGPQQKFGYIDNSGKLVREPQPAL